MDTLLLKVRDMKVYYSSVRGDYKVVDGVSFQVKKNEIVGLAGESGCGKSTLVEGILRLVVPPGRIVSGQVIAPTIAWQTPEKMDLLSLSEEEFRRVRWKEISYIPQGSMNSLNPVMKVKDQMADAMLAHDPTQKEKLEERIGTLLTAVGLPAEVAGMYPHELSGGMKQRVIIGMAIALNPQLIIADEPTTALDVTIQRVIIQTLLQVRRQFGSAIVVVSHDMPVHAQMCDRLVIMYAAKVMEIGSTIDIFDKALHPYTQGLIKSIPAITDNGHRPEGIPGVAPSPIEWPEGCRFHPRCPQVFDRCRHEEPALREVALGRLIACHLYDRCGGQP